MTETRKKLSEYDTFSSAIPLVSKKLYAALAHLGEDAWYESLETNLAKFIRLLEPTKKPWRPLLLDIDIARLTPEKLLGSLSPSSWPFQLSKEEEKSLTEFIIQLNRLIKVLNNHDIAIEKINYFFHFVSSGTKNQLLKELNEKSEELRWLFSKKLWKTLDALEDMEPVVITLKKTEHKR